VTGDCFESFSERNPEHEMSHSHPRVSRSRSRADAQISPAFLLKNQIALPPGEIIITLDGLWIVSPDFLTLTFFADPISLSYNLSVFLLDFGKSPIKNLGFLNTRKDLFIFVSCTDSPKLLLYFYSSSITRTVPLDSLHIHNAVLDVFSPYDDVFCVISRQGISLHSPNLFLLFSYSCDVHDYCFSANMVALGTRGVMFIYHFEKGVTPYLLLKVRADVFGFPTQIHNTTDTVTFVFSTGKARVIQRLPYVTSVPIPAISTTFCNLSPVFGGTVRLEQISLTHYDNGVILSTDTESIFVDVQLQSPIIIGTIPIPNARCFSEGFITAQGKVYSIEADYGTLTNTDNLDVIGALMRRRDGLSAALVLLRQALTKVSSIAEMDDIVWKVGTFAVAPLAQLRFARALQFGAIGNTHLILRGIITFTQIMGQKLTDQAYETLCEIMFHDDCKWTLGGLLSTWNWKLEKRALVSLAKKTKEVFEIDPLFAENLLDFADVCVEFGQEERARNLLVRASLDGEVDPGKFHLVVAKYVEKFGVEKARMLKVFMGDAPLDGVGLKCSKP
jgi:hypothetical protein